MQRGLVVVVVLALVLGGLPSRASAELTGSSGPVVAHGPAGQSVPCTDPLGAGRRPELGATLALSEENVGPPAQWGRPVLCLFGFPTEDVYNVVMTGIDNVEQFRAAKAEAVGKLQGRGIDLCKITQWSVWGTPNQPGYTNEDLLSEPLVCPPRVLSGDDDAGAYLQTARESVARGLTAGAADFGWQPDEPIVIIVVTNVDSAAQVYRRHRSVLETPDVAEQAARQGVSRRYYQYGSSTIYGKIAFINLADPNQRTTAKIDLEVQRSLSYFGLIRTTGRDPTIPGGNVDNLPEWLRSGLLNRFQYLHALNGASGGYLVEAARAVRNGQTLSLAQLVTAEQSAEAVKQSDPFVVAARDYVAVAYLYDRFGDAAMRQQLQDLHNRSRADVTGILTNLTGVDVNGLDAAVNAWLLERPRFLSANPEGRLKVEMVTYSDGQHGEVLVDEAAATCLFDVRSGSTDANRPGIVGFSVTLGPDGSFTAVRPSTYVGNSVTLTGRVDSGQLSGTYRVVNEVTGCDGGAIPFGPA
ncbi:MAG: hypothetical protein U0893_11550 [Chloroflexota bacterium]